MSEDHPILMAGPLVRATLEGAKPEYARSYPAKTQTRRPIKRSYREGFRSVWQSIYGTWDLNPWVWVAEWKEIILGWTRSLPSRTTRRHLSVSP